MRALFICSTGRTGTDFFTHLVNEAVDNAWSLHEPWPAFRKRASALVRRAPNAFERVYFRWPRLWRHRRSGCTWYVETNYHLFAAIPLIRQAFPQARVVHIVRDGRAVVRSWLDRWRYITNDHIVPSDFADDPARYDWPHWNPLQKLAWYWKTVQQVALRGGPDLVLRFEDIFADGAQGVFRVLELMPEVRYDPAAVRAALARPVNENPVRFFPDYREWPSSWREQFWAIAGAEMAKWGYVRDD